MRERILNMMRKRGWALDWSSRGVYLHLEVSELIEAVRGKAGNTLEESADVLIVLLSLSPHDLNEIITKAEKKVEMLETALQYEWEEIL